MRLENISAPASGLNYGYTYDNASNILTKTTEHGTYGYDYDNVYRLLTADNPTQENEAYTYDNAGNRATASNASGAVTHNTNNELTFYGDINYDYDPSTALRTGNGNLTRKSIGSVATTYSYNVQNRLIRVEDELSPSTSLRTGSIIADYGYDPFGRRLWKEVNGVRTYFFYSDEGLVAKYDESGNELRSYGYKPDSTWTTDPLWLKQDGEYYFYQNDHLGTPQKLIDITGTVVWSAQYTAFGKADVQIETITNNLRFPGQYYDVETGLHYNYHRYYDSGIGRYLRQDPIGVAGGINVFTYAHNTPLNAFDPMGLAVGELTLTGAALGSPTGAAVGALIGLGLAGGGYAVCLATGVCQLPDEMPHLDLGAPSTTTGGYPAIRPRSPFFPQIPSIADMCDPGDNYFPPPETWKASTGEPWIPIQPPRPSVPCQKVCGKCDKAIEKNSPSAAYWCPICVGCVALNFLAKGD